MRVKRPLSARMPTVPPTSAQSTSQSIKRRGSVMCGRTCLCSMINARLLSSSRMGSARTASQQSWSARRWATSDSSGGRFFLRCCELSDLMRSGSGSDSDSDESKTPVEPSPGRSSSALRFLDECDGADLTTGVAQNHSLSSEDEVGMVVRDSRTEMVLGMRDGGRGGGEGLDEDRAKVERSVLRVTAVSIGRGQGPKALGRTLLRGGTSTAHRRTGPTTSSTRRGRPA